MKRTLATISTEEGIARIEHNSENSELLAIYQDGVVEHISDYYPTKSWMAARKQVIALYANTVAYHDSWVLCLRPTKSLRVSRSEEHSAAVSAK